MGSVTSSDSRGSHCSYCRIDPFTFFFNFYAQRKSIDISEERMLRSFLRNKIEHKIFVKLSQVVIHREMSRGPFTRY